MKGCNEKDEWRRWRGGRVEGVGGAFHLVRFKQEQLLRRKSEPRTKRWSARARASLAVVA